MNEWRHFLSNWQAIVEIDLFSPASEESIRRVRTDVEKLPVALEELYRVTNGIRAGTFKVLPIADKSDIARTWDSIERANNPASSRFLGRSKELLSRFIVFADIGAGRAGASDRTDGSIWFQANGELCQTDFDLKSFVEANLKENRRRDLGSLASRSRPLLKKTANRAPRRNP